MTERQSLLFIEDNEDLLYNILCWFEERGYICDCARNGGGGLALVENGSFDCVVLDIMLPGMDGLEICKRLRQNGSNVPVIMLTAKDSVEDKIAGLDCGADDYLVKPFSLKELEARIKAILRRGRPVAETRSFGNITIDPARHRAFRDGRELRLSPACFRILASLLLAAPEVVRKEKIEFMLWGDNPPEGSALRNHIHELRKVVDKPFDVPVIETVPHIGWRLALPEK